MLVTAWYSISRMASMGGVDMTRFTPMCIRRYVFGYKPGPAFCDTITSIIDLNTFHFDKWLHHHFQHLRMGVALQTPCALNSPISSSMAFLHSADDTPLAR